MGSSPNERLDYGMMGYGCQHYRRRCKIRAPCCYEIFSCRHCHNETAAMLRNPSDRHELIRQDVMQVVCSVCDTEQHVEQVCSNCGVMMGEYFCSICKFYDDDTSKSQFHCDDCGICRVGGRENFFHCKKCGSCYSIGLRKNHLCVENSMRHHCPICYEYLFDSLKDTTVMKCGHTMHGECLTEMLNRDKYCCPICSRSVIDMLEPGRDWTRRLKRPSCQRTTVTRRCGFFVMTAMTRPRCISTSSVKNVVTAIRTIRALSQLLLCPGDCSIPHPEHETGSTLTIGYDGETYLLLRGGEQMTRRTRTATIVRIR